MTARKQVALVVGASRGIGRTIAIELARNNYIVVLSAKSTSDASRCKPFPPNPNSSESTISTVHREITEGGGEALAIPCDVRETSQIETMVNAVVEKYAGIDVVVYNSGAIWWASVENTPLKRFQLMQRINPEGLYATVQACLPVFKKQDWNARVVVVSPPIYSRFFRGKTAYAMGKVGMSVLTKGMAMDWEREGKRGMAITSIWPASAIESAATERAVRADSESEKDLRKASIFSDAVLSILAAPQKLVNGLLTLDEDFLREQGVTDFSKYSVVEGTVPRRIMPAKFPDLRVDEQDDEGKRFDSSKLGKVTSKL